MKKVLFLVGILVSSQASAWIYGPGPYGYGGYGYMPYGYGYGGYGYMYPPLQVPSFNYQTTIVQQPPPVIIQEPRVIEKVITPPPKIEYKYKPCDDACFKRYYMK